ncbi:MULTISPECIES: hypothetical protein [unclassified Cryobacterium]|uniref:hypothetical protein n=1 Tax=unclassified Cryobacterium TaxID=2649013 RepID=UPI00106D01AB|nr:MULTISPECIES: hypothetical protein [unclassified Cryobacterium]TFC59430.1 hypothetical protein E3O68_00590 [Cryobacterium sp. TMB3-1-2]TFC67226.1 hypothetical protein E3T21_17285 [Cryobacterium sp. TMB3-15]TFC73261.1 hypothetical protein E3T22_16770 [Cryobacterium sp. TMB3-10]TFD46149.1 hypothetical protein E3T58_01405 [Cryobacterium sp. TMB3-12]
MTDPTEDAPCARGCTWPAADEDEAPRPKPAKHGRLCNSDFYRLTAALRLVPDLMANMRAQLFTMGVADYSEKVSGGGGEAPAPLNLGPLDASDALFAKLHSWVAFFAEDLHVAAPAMRTWASDREVQGSRSVSVEVAAANASTLAGWLLARADQILSMGSAVAFYEDIVVGQDDARGIFSLSSQYGINARPAPQADMRECPECEHWTVLLKMPNSFDAEYGVICGRCGWVAATDFFAKHTGRAGYVAITATRPGICSVCVDRIFVGTLINKIDDLTMHHGCQGVIGDEVVAVPGCLAVDRWTPVDKETGKAEAERTDHCWLSAEHDGFHHGPRGTFGPPVPVPKKKEKVTT